MLACSFLLPDGWVQVPAPDDEYNLDNPAVFIPVVVCMAPYGAVIFTIAARPAFDDGTVQDWAEYLAGVNEVTVTQINEARINRMPCVLIDGTMNSEMGEMRSRSVFLEDGQRLFNIGTLAPAALWSSVEADFARLVGAFRLDDVHGITAAPMRQMTSDGTVDLTTSPTPDVPSTSTESPQNTTTASASATATAVADTGTNASPDSDSTMSDASPTTAAHVALADDSTTLDPEHAFNVQLRNQGVGLVPRVVQVVDADRYAIVAAGAIVSTFHVPFGWHVIDDGSRTLVFDPDGSVQINLSLRPGDPNDASAVLDAIGQSLASENPQAQFMTLDLLGFPCLAVRDLLVNGEQLDQAYLARPSHAHGLTLVCRVTASREHFTRAMNTAEVVLRAMNAGVEIDSSPESASKAPSDSVLPEKAPSEEPSSSTDEPAWWRNAVELEYADRIDEAEQIILGALDHLGVFSQLAYLHEQRFARLSAEGRAEDARRAKERAIYWLHNYAASATSGGEGAALSYERDQRIAALGGEN